jgi:glycosyltransferase involved in cell wall biosynthesis
MRLLFIHQNFPGQYAHVLRRFAADPGNEIVFVTRHANAAMPGIRKIVYRLQREVGEKTHFYVRSVEEAVLHAQAVARVAFSLKRQGFVPDAMIGHNGWGETLYLKDVFPAAPLLSYFEFYYHAQGADIGFDPEFPPSLDVRLRVHTLNAVNLMGLEVADQGQTATAWQRGRYPERYRDMIEVAHEGVDTERAKPDPTAVVRTDSGVTLSRADEVVTYVARNLEPYRGFHVFMRALPEILRRHPKAQVLIVGADKVGYGSAAPGDASWRETLLQEVGASLDASRVHFMGRVPYDAYLKVLQVSTAHVYFSYPFVLSWSMLEAMAAGCVVVGSATPPVEEVIEDGTNGLLVPFFDANALAETVSRVLADRHQFTGLARRARDDVRERFDLRAVCLPRHVQIIESLMQGSAPEPGAVPLLRAPLRDARTFSFDPQEIHHA